MALLNAMQRCSSTHDALKSAVLAASPSTGATSSWGGDMSTLYAHSRAAPSRLATRAGVCSGMSGGAERRHRFFRRAIRALLPQFIAGQRDGDRGELFGSVPELGIFSTGRPPAMQRESSGTRCAFRCVLAFKALCRAMYVRLPAGLLLRARSVTRCAGAGHVVHGKPALGLPVPACSRAGDAHSSHDGRLRRGARCGSLR